MKLHNFRNWMRSLPQYYPEAKSEKWTRTVDPTPRPSSRGMYSLTTLTVDELENLLEEYQLDLT